MVNLRIKHIKLSMLLDLSSILLNCIVGPTNLCCFSLNVEEPFWITSYFGTLLGVSNVVKRTHGRFLWKCVINAGKEVLGVFEHVLVSMRLFQKHSFSWISFLVSLWKLSVACAWLLLESTPESLRGHSFPITTKEKLNLWSIHFLKMYSGDRRFDLIQVSVGTFS